MIIAAAFRFEGKVYALPAPARHGDIIHYMVRRGAADSVPSSAEQVWVPKIRGI